MSLIFIYSSWWSLKLKPLFLRYTAAKGSGHGLLIMRNYSLPATESLFDMEQLLYWAVCHGHLCKAWNTVSCNDTAMFVKAWWRDVNINSSPPQRKRKFDKEKEIKFFVIVLSQCHVVLYQRLVLCIITPCIIEYCVSKNFVIDTDSHVS